MSKNIITKHRLIKNSIECKRCGDVIESNFRHDFKWCECGSIAVDGGLDYSKRVGDMHYMIDRSEYVTYQVEIDDELDLYGDELQPEIDELDFS